MPQSDADHPSLADLQSFAEGRLDGAEATVVERHLENCPECCSTLSKPTKDGFVSRLRALGEVDVGLAEARTDSPPGVLPVVPGYEVHEELGRGGMGVVYRARHLRLNRVVALKLILAGDLARPSELVRFRAEAEVAAQFQHSHIVQIHEIGDHAGRPYIAFEYVPGGSLEHLTHGTPQPPADVARFVSLLARTVAHAHARGVVHRDLKPANVLIGSESASENSEHGPDDSRTPLTLATAIPKIADFGLAKWRDHDQGLTATVVVAGTPSYMAPEQARGELATIGPAADVYALGAILYELMTGRPPFKGANSLDTLSMVLEAEPLPPHQFQPRTPRDLETVCLKCLHKEPARRYATASELADDLDRWSNVEPIHARPVSSAERAWRWARRRPALSSLIAGLAVVTLLGIAGILWQWRQADWERGRAEANERDALMSQAATAEALEQAERSVYLTRIARVRLDWLHNHDVANADALLEQCGPRPGAKDYRGWEWHHLRRLVRGDRLSLAGHAGDYVADVAFSSDGTQIASTAFYPFNLSPGSSRLVELFLWDAVTGTKQKSLASPPRSIQRVAFSPDGKWFAAVSLDGVQLWDRHGTMASPTRVIGTDNRSVAALVFSPDGTKLAWGNDRGTVGICEIATGRLLRRRQVGQTIVCTAFSPTGERLATCGKDPSRGIWVVEDVESGRDLSQGQTQGAGGRAVFSPDLSQLAVVDGPIRLWDVATGRLLQALAGHQGPVTALAYHPDGKTLASCGSDRTVRLWDVQTGQERDTLRGHSGRVACLRFDATGRRLVSGGEQPPEVMVWDLDRPTIHRTHRPPAIKDNTEGIAFDASGDHLVSIYPGGAVHLINVASGASVERRAELLLKWQAPARLAAIRTHAAGLSFVTVGQTDQRTVKLWEMSTASDPGPATCIGELQGHTTNVYQTTLSDDGRWVATAALERTPTGEPIRREVMVWDWTTRQPVARFDPIPNTQERLHGALSISADGKWVAFDDYTAGVPGSRVRVIEVATQRIVWELVGHTATVSALAFSEDGRRLASADRSGRLWLWDLATGVAVPATLRGPSYALAFSPDSQRLAAVDRKELKLWDAVTGQEILTLQGRPPSAGDPGFNPCVAWSRDGRRLAASNHDLTLTVWDGAEPPVPQSRSD